MQGYKPYQEKLLSVINLRKMIPENHLLIQIDKQIDFSFIYALTKNLYCNDNGRPLIDPVLFFRMQIVSYLFGIQSNRQLCKEVHLRVKEWIADKGYGRGPTYEYFRSEDIKPIFLYIVKI